MQRKWAFHQKNNTFCHIFSSEFEYPWTYPFTHKINFLWKQFSQASNIFQISHDVFQLFQSREICCYVWSITHWFQILNLSVIDSPINGLGSSLFHFPVLDYNIQACLINTSSQKLLKKKMNLFFFSTKYLFPVLYRWGFYFLFKNIYQWLIKTCNNFNYFTQLLPIKIYYIT